MQIAHSFSPERPTVVEPFELAGAVLARALRDMAKTASAANRADLIHLAEKAEGK